MDAKTLKSRIPALAAVAIASVVCVAAWALPPYQQALFARYPNAAATLPNCVACHDGPGANSLNDFGSAFLANGFALDATLEALDSDGDGATNAEELTASPATGPGDPSSRPGVAGNPTPPPAPVTDGPTLYANNCAACHQPLATSTKGGATLARMQSAITGNVGGMGYLSGLSLVQLQAIEAALAPSTPPVTPPVTAPPVTPPPATVIDGATLYANQCAACHGGLPNSTKVGATLARTQGAIAGNVGGMGFLSRLSTDELQAITAALAPATTSTLRRWARRSTTPACGGIPTESGWSISVNHQGNVVFATLLDVRRGWRAALARACHRGLLQADGQHLRRRRCTAPTARRSTRSRSRRSAAPTCQRRHDVTHVPTPTTARLSYTYMGVADRQEHRAAGLRASGGELQLHDRQPVWAHQLPGRLVESGGVRLGALRRPPGQHAVQRALSTYDFAGSSAVARLTGCAAARRVLPGRPLSDQRPRVQRAAVRADHGANIAKVGAMRSGVCRRRQRDAGVHGGRRPGVEIDHADGLLGHASPRARRRPRRRPR